MEVAEITAQLKSIESKIKLHRSIVSEFSQQVAQSPDHDPAIAEHVAQAAAKLIQLESRERSLRRLKVAIITANAYPIANLLSTDLLETPGNSHAGTESLLKLVLVKRASESGYPKCVYDGNAGDIK